MLADAGHTLFSRARNLESTLGLQTIHLKFEGSNPTGTQKDRIATYCYEDAHRLGYDTITLATCGNFGASIAWACSRNGIRPTVFVPEEYHLVRAHDMERHGARIVRVAGCYEDAVVASRNAAKENGWYDANPGSDAQWEIARQGYGRIAHEIYANLGRMPDTCAVAVGNGTTLAAIHDGFLQVKREHGLEEPVPRMIASSTPRGNPIIKSWKLGLAECVDLDPKDVKETEINEPLTNWHSFDGQRALDAIRASQGFAFYASDAAMRRVTSLIRNVEGLAVMTASTAALVGLHRAKESGLVQDGLHIAVLTGRTPEKPRARIAHTAISSDRSAVSAH